MSFSTLSIFSGLVLVRLSGIGSSFALLPNCGSNEDTVLRAVFFGWLKCIQFGDITDIGFL
jgi:hypothetical protein